jgi:hypothetical protein
MDWIDLTEDRDWWRVLVNMGMNFQVQNYWVFGLHLSSNILEK